MTPRTRSATKTSPGRTTRNSLYGRPPPPSPQPRKPRKSTATTTAPVAVPVPDVAVQPTHEDHHDSENVAPVPGQGTPWLACRDAQGVYTTVAVSQTGQGIHVRWYDDNEVRPDGVLDEENADVAMDMDDTDSNIGRGYERGLGLGLGLGPQLGTSHSFIGDAGPSNPTVSRHHHHPRRAFLPQTPIERRPFDAGSVLLTPIKNTRQLQRSPARIGDKGVRCLYDQGGVLCELNNGQPHRVVFHHPVGSSANLSRRQVAQLEQERERKIIEEQLAKMMAEKRRVEAMEAMDEVDDQSEGVQEYFSDSGYEEEMVVDGQPAQSREVGMDLLFSRGPNGELLDRDGRPMFGPEGTVLLYQGLRAVSEVPTEIIEEEEELTMEEDANEDEEQETQEQAPQTRKVRFGPEGTELIDW